MDASLTRKYIDAVFGAVCAMSGNSFGDVTPQTTNERVVAIITMVIGATAYAKIFSDFEYIVSSLGKEKKELRYASDDLYLSIRNTFRAFEDYCKIKRMDQAVIKKLKDYEDFLDKKNYDSNLI